MSRLPTKLWTHFHKRDDAPFMAVCRHCLNSFSYRTSTGNLNAHLRRCHTSIYINSYKKDENWGGPASASQTPKLGYSENNSASKKAAIIENPASNNASPANYTSHDDSNSAPLEDDSLGHSYDEYTIFGDYVANELRNMNYLKYRGELKRKIQKLIIEYTERDENEFLAHTSFESASTDPFKELPTSEPAAELPSTSQDVFTGCKSDIVKLEIVDDPLPEIE